MDVIEPWHPRQTWGNERIVYLLLSYGFGIIRWRNAILLIQPSLELNINAIEFLHREFLNRLLSSFDRNALYHDGNRIYLALIFNDLYEAVCSLRPHSALDESAIDHFRSTLEHRISVLYLTILPVPRSRKERKELQTMAKLFGAYPRTASRLPREYHDHALGLPDSFVLEAQNNLSYDGERFLSFREPPGSSTSCFPVLSGYVPARFLSVFRLDADVLSRGRHEIAGNIFTHLERLEELLSADPLLNTQAGVLFLVLSPHALAFTMKAFFDALATTRMTTTLRLNRLVCLLIIWTSIEVCKDFVKEGLARECEELATWLKTWPHLSHSMYSWFEQNKLAEALEQGFASSLLEHL
jgi:hypothetical protein